MTSAAIAILTVTLLLLILSFFLLAPMVRESPPVVVYQSDEVVEQTQQRKIERKVDQKPTAPSSAMSKVIVSNIQSNISVPTPEINADMPSLNFGDDIDFGQGWGTGGTGGGEASFFKQKVSAQRIAYVIDYSGSMTGQRDKLMRAELTKSISNLPGGIDYQLIFFAGPTWIAGDKVTLAGSNKVGTVIHKGKTIEWSGQGAHNWKPVGNLPRAEWLQGSRSNIKKSLEIIASEKLIYGTAWGPALNLALDMNPPPQFIFFMTDGDAGASSMRVAEDAAKKAKSRNVKINTVAMMQPKAEKQMALLAERTGGKFSTISVDGTVTEKN